MPIYHQLDPMNDNQRLFIQKFSLYKSWGGDPMGKFVSLFEMKIPHLSIGADVSLQGVMHTIHKRDSPFELTKTFLMLETE